MVVSSWGPIPVPHQVRYTILFSIETDNIGKRLIYFVILNMNIITINVKDPQPYSLRLP